jgi:P-type Ca2+ transporter type 2C
MLSSIVATISLSLDFNQDFGQKCSDGEPPSTSVEGIAILITILVIVIVGFLNDRQKVEQLRALNENRVVKAIRDDEEQVIDIRNVVVGNIVLFESGEVIPCDGVFFSGHKVRCDGSGATGESDAIKKLPPDGEQLLDSEVVAFSL